MHKTLLVVASYGTTCKQSWQKSIGAVEKHLSQTFLCYEVRRCFTNQIVCNSLQKAGEHIMNTSQTLEQAYQEGFQTIILQPTHLINGTQYKQLEEQINPFIKQFEHFFMGAPLLSCGEDLQIIAQTISNLFPYMNRKAIVLVGHGTKGSLNHIYQRLQERFYLIGRFDILIGTLGDWGNMNQIAERLNMQNNEKIILMPLLLTAGYHFIEKIAGENSQSWKSYLQEQGFSVEVCNASLGEYNPIQKIYEQHVREARIIHS